MNKYQEASEEYKKNPKSATKIAKQFGLNVSHFCKYLKSIGIQVINNQNRTKFNECIFDIIDTEEKAYWLGFILADGSISSCKTQKRYQFELSLSEQDKAHLDKFNVFMQHEKDNVKLSYTWVNGKKFSRCRWIINNKHLWSRLNELGCIPNKTLLLTFPYVPKSLVKHLIRGYFDGDGSLGIYTYKSSTKVSCSCIGTSEMLNNILKNVQINANLKHDKRHSPFIFSFELVSAKCKKFLDYIYKDCSIYLERKYQKYLTICRLFEESNRVLETKIGESCDANPEVIKEVKSSLAP